MTARPQLLAAATLLLAPAGSVPDVARAAAAAVPFAEAAVHFEQNATDGDVEVVFEVKGGDEGLSTLRVVSPDGRTVIDFVAPDASTLGIRQFRFESPEPGDVASLKLAYPEGVYTFTGKTAAGGKFEGESTLYHTLPPPGTLLRPKADATGVAPSGLEIAWTPMKNLAAYIVYVEQDDGEITITARLPATAARFAVPAGVLRPGKVYQLGIGTVTSGGNISFVETTFTTAGKE